MTSLTSIPQNQSPVHLSRILLGLIVAVSAFDLCFWGINSLGFSVSIFFLILAGVILTNRESSRWNLTTGIMLMLLAGAAFAATIETGFTNILVLLVLIVVLAGETFFRDDATPWGRGISQLVALARAPGRIFWLGSTLLEIGSKRGVGLAGSFIGGCLLMIPALLLALIFGWLLATGNAVFNSWTNTFFDSIWKIIENYFDLARIVMWFFSALWILPLLRPAHISTWWWSWTERLPRLPEILPTRGALFCSGLILVVLNLLFFLANIADALFLWSGAALPAGVTYKSYVHQGVDALIVTVILTAIVLTAIFQQALSVARRRELKVLAFLWIAQNLFLLMSVTLRLKYYIEAYEMTVARLSVIIFLMLVAVGFVLLTIKIVRDRSLSWLVGGCLIAVFVTFYITQFLDLAGWSANYNVSHWQKGQIRNLDFFHLYEAGPDAWPALRRAHESDPSIAILNRDSAKGALTESTVSRVQFDSQHWREFSLRAWLNRDALEEKSNN